MNLAAFYRHCRYVEDQLTAFFMAESLSGEVDFSNLEVKRNVDRITVRKRSSISTSGDINLRINGFQSIIVEHRGFLWQSADELKYVLTLDKLKQYFKWEASTYSISFGDYIKQKVVN